MDETNTCTERDIWRRAHRPEEYIGDVIKYLSKETGVPAALLMPLIPIGSAMLRSWPDAALEYTEYAEHDDGARTLRTFFHIHNFSNSSVYSLIETLLKAIGVGRATRLKQPDIDFAWILLGGVLSDYADCAGVSRITTEALLEFRLRNSDYNTVTTWRTDTVEIANLVTGRVETLDLPPEDIAKVVDWAVKYQKSIKGKKSICITPDCGEHADFTDLFDRYTDVCASAAEQII